MALKDGQSLAGWIINQCIEQNKWMESISPHHIYVSMFIIIIIFPIYIRCVYEFIDTIGLAWLISYHIEYEA